MQQKGPAMIWLVVEDLDAGKRKGHAVAPWNVAKGCVQRPVKTGLVLSRKAWKPMRKSSVSKQA